MPDVMPLWIPGILWTHPHSQEFQADAAALKKLARFPQLRMLSIAATEPFDLALTYWFRCQPGAQGEPHVSFPSTQAGHMTPLDKAPRSRVQSF